MTSKAYTAVLWRDEDGWWIADFPDVPGCHTQGKTLRAVRGRLRDALSLWVDDANKATIIERFDFPEKLTKAIEHSKVAREDAETYARDAAAATRDAAVELTRAGLTMRDTAALLGLSHQRIQQLVSG